MDGTFGTYISTVTTNGKTWTFNPFYLFAGRGYTIATTTEADFTSANFTLASTVESPSGTFTYTYNGAAAYVGLQVKLTVAITGDAIYFKAPEIVTCPAGIAVMKLRFPNVDVQSYGTNANAWGVLGGAIIPLPVTRTDAGGLLRIDPPSMMYSGLYDSVSKECLMLYSDDESGHGLMAKLTGTTTSTKLYFDHLMDRRYTGGTLSAKTYNIRLQQFTGLSTQGAMCYQDFADRYRTWARNPSRPWASRGHWSNAPTVSSRIKSKGFVFNAQEGTALIKTEIERLATYLGVDRILARWQFVPSYVSTAPNPNATPTAAYLTALDALIAQGVDVSIYTIPTQWLNSLTTPYDPTNYSTFGDVRPMMIHTKAGAVAQNQFHSYIWDYTHASTDDVINSLIDGFYALHTRSQPTGTYVDVLYHYVEPTLGVSQEDLAADTGWTFALHQAGIATTATAIRTARRAAVSESILNTELIDPVGTLNIVDLAGIWRPHTTYEGGNDTRSGPYIFGELVRVAKLDGISLAEGSASFVYGTIQAVTRDWMATGIAALSDTSAGNALVDADPASGTFGPLWAWVKKCCDMALGPALPYFRGKRVIGFGDAFTTTLDATDFTSFEEARIAAYCGGEPIQTCVWQAQDGRLGIIIAHCFTAGMTSIIAPTPGARSVTITLVPAAYGLSSTTQYLLMQNVNGNYTPITTWTPTGTLTQSVTVQENTINLFELMPAAPNMNLRRNLSKNKSTTEEDAA